jgi:hypothetical protein
MIKFRDSIENGCFETKYRLCVACDDEFGEALQGRADIGERSGA